MTTETDPNIALYQFIRRLYSSLIGFLRSVDATTGRIATSLNQHRTLWFVLYALFILGLYYEHSHFFMFHDDFGLAVLHYVAMAGDQSRGTFTQSEIISFLYQQYMRWTPRFGSAYVQIIASTAGLPYLRMTQVALIASYVVLAMRITTGKGVAQPLILVPLLYYALLFVFTIVAMAWFAAAAGYIWGLPLFALGILRLIHKVKLDFLSTACFAISCFFHEQLGAAVLAFLGTYCLLHARDKQAAIWSIKGLVCLFLVLAAMAVVVFSPGNAARNEIMGIPFDSTLAMILHNWKFLGDMLTVPERSYPLALFIAGTYWLALFVACCNLKSPRWILGCVLGACVPFFVAKFPVFWPLFILAYCAALFLAAYSARETPRHLRILLCLCAAAAVSICVYLVVPNAGHRILMQGLFLSLMPVLLVFHLCRKTPTRLAAVLLLLVFLPQGIANTKSRMKKIESNYPYLQANHLHLEAARFDYILGMKKAEDVSSEPPMRLYKIPCRQYAHVMPYDRDLILIWLKKYYGLPKNLTLEWVDPPEAAQMQCP